MKLVIATATATMLGIAAATPGAGVAQTTQVGEETASSVSDLASESGEAGAPEAADTSSTAAPADPAAQLAEAKTAALAAAAAPGVMDDPLIANVADYALFQRDLTVIEERPISEPEDLDAVMDTLASYDGATLNNAFMSYAAFLGAQQTEFVDRVKEVAEYYGVDQLVQGMINEPEYVLSFPGARDAAAAVLDVLREDVQSLVRMGDRFKQESYDLQNRGWSNLIAEDREERLNAIRDAQRLITPSEDLLASVAYGAPISSAEPAGSGQLRRTAFWSAVDYRPDPAHTAAATAGDDAESLGVMMTLAALRTLNVSQSRPDLVEHLLNLPTAKSCLDFALLHLRQCVAAAHFKYEDAFCIAEHQLLDISRCLGRTVNASAGLPPARETVTQAAVETPAAAEPAEAPTATN